MMVGTTVLPRPREAAIVQSMKPRCSSKAHDAHTLHAASMTAPSVVKRARNCRPKMNSEPPQHEPTPKE